MECRYLTDYLDYNAGHYGQQPAIIFEGETITWRQLWQKVEALSFFFANELGDKKQELVAILMPNSIECVVAYLAIIHSGHMVLLLDPAYKKLELDAIIGQNSPRLLICDNESAGQVSKTHGFTLYTELIKKPAEKAALLRLPPEELVASLTFTSGTTGKPKTVPNTHSNHIWNIKVCSQVWGWTHKDTLLVNVPLSHMLGIVMGLSGILYHGNTMYLQRWFNEAETLKALSSGKISFFSHAASAYVKLLQLPPKGYDLSAVRLCVSGGAPLPPAVWRQFKNYYGIEILETYGTSETGRIAGNSLSERMLGSPGKILNGVDFKLSDESEVLIKSPGVFPGYYNNSEATREATTPDGYWRTGDLAEMNDGYIFLKGRVQERIRRFGYTVSPRDVEWALHKHPKVKDIHVMGRQVPGDPNDELIYFIVGDVTEKEVAEFAKDNLLFAWRPDKVIHMDELPRTSSGKARIAKLKDLAGQYS